MKMPFVNASCVIFIMLFSGTAMATLFSSDAILKVNMINNSGYLMDQIIFNGFDPNVTDPTANFTAGLEPGEKNTSSLEFRAVIGGDSHYTNSIIYYTTFSGNFQSEYCTVNFGTTPTYYAFVANRVYPTQGSVSGSCSLEVNSNSEITITLEVP